MNLVSTPLSRMNRKYQKRKNGDITDEDGEEFDERSGDADSQDSIPTPSFVNCSVYPAHKVVN